MAENRVTWGRRTEEAVAGILGISGSFLGKTKTTPFSAEKGLTPTKGIWWEGSSGRKGGEAVFLNPGCPLERASKMYTNNRPYPRLITPDLWRGAQVIDFSHVYLGLRNKKSWARKAENPAGIFKNGAVKGMGNGKLETIFVRREPKFERNLEWYSELCVKKSN